ncbi:hypothetical protein, partial [Aeromonas media]
SYVQLSRCEIMAKSKIQFQKVTTHITDNIYDLLRRNYRFYQHIASRIISTRNLFTPGKSPIGRCG